MTDGTNAGTGLPFIGVLKSLPGTSWARGAWPMPGRLSAVARAQLSSKLFFNDLPVTYNSSTSGRFGSRPSLFTLGLRLDF